MHGKVGKYFVYLIFWCVCAHIPTVGESYWSENRVLVYVQHCICFSRHRGPKVLSLGFFPVVGLVLRILKSITLLWIQTIEL